MFVKATIFAAVAALSGGSANAAVIDFTNAASGSTGSMFGGAVSWTMTASGERNNMSTTAEKRDWIEIAFSRPTLVNAVYFLDLFVARKGKSREVGLATFDGEAIKEVVATDRVDVGAPGFAAGVFEPILAKTIRFSVVRSEEIKGKADGKLSGIDIDIATVPLPATGGLLLGAIGGWMILRRRKRA